MFQTWSSHLDWKYLEISQDEVESSLQTEPRRAEENKYLAWEYNQVKMQGNINKKICVNMQKNHKYTQIVITTH